MIKLCLFFLFLNFSKSCSYEYYDYCLIGAGPAGLQMAYFLQKENRNYILFERNNKSGK